MSRGGVVGWGMLIGDAAAYAIEAHGSQMYGDRPYAVHLSAVAHILTEWGAAPEVIAAGWLHDVIEDTAVCFPDLLTAFGPRVAHIVWAVTAEGATRADKMASIYRKISVSPDAALVKMADRIANVEAAGGSRHMDRYRHEAEAFRAAVGGIVPAEAISRLDAALAA